MKFLMKIYSVLWFVCDKIQVSLESSFIHVIMVIFFYIVLASLAPYYTLTEVDFMVKELGSKISAFFGY